MQSKFTFQINRTCPNSILKHCFFSKISSTSNSKLCAINLQVFVNRIRKICELYIESPPLARARWTERERAEKQSHS